MGSLCIDNCSRVRGGSLGGKGIGKMSRGFIRAARVALIVALLLAFCVCCFGATGEVVQRKGFVAGTSGYVAKGPFISTVVNAASGSANPWDWTGTLGIMDGSDDFTVIDINVTNADHTGSSNTVQAIDINGITGDAHATETGIKIGAGWDVGIDSASPALLHVLATDTITCAGGTTVLTSAYYGKTVFITGDAAQTITLPANGAAAGSWMRFVVIGSDSTVPTIAAATADTLIAPNDAAADSVTFGSGHRIGACVMLISTGTYWVAINEGSTTMTVTT